MENFQNFAILAHIDRPSTATLLRSVGYGAGDKQDI